LVGGKIMIFGYTPLDPLVVLIGTAIALRYLQKKPLRLIGFMPAALSLWFFFPTITNLTLWQTVPMLLTGRLLLKGHLRLPQSAKTVLAFVLLAFAGSALFALLGGSHGTRAAIRIVYYLGVFALLSFAYEMGRKPDCYETLLKGLVAVGIIYSLYGVYQIFAFYTGLPLRGIVYNASSSGSMAYEGGLLRINSLANEPKRLGYVLFLSGLACFFLARMRTVRRARQLRWAGYGIFAVSIMTFAGSYFLAVALFVIAVLLIYPSRATKYILGIGGVSLGVALAFPDLLLLDALQIGYERRMAEVEVGLDGFVVYRQEFFAWDYLFKNPVSGFTGVGLGQYFSVLNQEYGLGAGYTEDGGLASLNSNFLEMVFDLGGITALIVYASLFFLVLRLRRSGETFLCLALLFLVVQSFTIINLLFLALFAGVALGQLQRRKENFPREIVASTISECSLSNTAS
jgi:hypothetical protein